MKSSLFIFVYLFLFSLAGIAQDQPKFFLFEKYMGGTVLLKNKARVEVPLNYDAANRNMMYLNGNSEMILNEEQGIDTIYIATKKFIPNGQHGFLEMVANNNCTVFVNWLLRKQLRGKKGAYGQIIQGSVEVLDVNAFKQQAGVARREDNVVDVYTQLNENEYWLLRNGKFVKCNNEKSLFKLFPGKEEQIKEFIREKKLNFRNTQHALEIINFCMGIDK